ncbi:hypothetical protein ARMGADRAFT_548426 [Armillaria gallica]|uniref:Uncharacterized protein n=1 Tax=Armillaria gallica TaxID=47427 RepID=A0A2H3DBJ7_ARMGA|nr:hypothetical protein ARMGADRAFT_548426 [Armillaria gallica]
MRYSDSIKPLRMLHPAEAIVVTAVPQALVLIYRAIIVALWIGEHEGYCHFLRGFPIGSETGHRRNATTYNDSIKRL